MNRSAILFDLDGTLTKPYLDFDAIRREIGIETGPILEAIAVMSGEVRNRAEKILLAHEWDAARNGTLQDEAVEVVARFRELGHAVALVTRNARVVVDFLLATHGFVFDAVRTRDDGAIKPSPEPVLSLCRELGVPVKESWVVGDYLFDIESGRAAGTRTVLMMGDGPRPDFADQADYVIERLSQLVDILSQSHARGC